MRVREALRQGFKTLLAHQTPSAGLAAELLLMHVTGRDRGWIYAEGEVELSAEQADTYFRLIAQRATGRPTQYITGHQEFWGLDLEVTPDVLIPRPETEHVLEAVLELARRPERAAAGRPLRIVDVGTGSGCIALALASELASAAIVAVDISPPALAVAARNAARLGMSGRIRFLESDLLASLVASDEAGRFDFVVSNPPYVGRDEIGLLQREVRDFEPPLAWGAAGEGDEVYRRLFPQAWQALEAGGHVVVEVGYNMSDRVVALLGPEWSEVGVRPDLAGIPRVVTARKKIP